jgi:outer membrane protein OmpA-like peptidoglycan-associated protein
MNRGRVVLGVVFLVVFLSEHAFGQAVGAEGLDSERFRPAMDSQGVITTEGGQGEESGDLNVGIILHYSRNPLVVTSGNDVIRSLVSDRLAGDFIVSMGMTDWLTLGVDVPAIFYQDGTMLELNTGADMGLSSAALGDIRVSPKFTILREKSHFVSLALAVPVSLPSGDDGAFLGSKSVTVSPTLALSTHLVDERLLLALNIGAWLMPEEADYRDLEVGHELFYRLGAGFRFTDDWWALAELFAGGRIETLGKNKPNEAPMEWLVGLRWQGPWDLTFSAGGGGGLLPGWGTPNFRFFMGLTWSPRVRDKDGDGVADDQDKCPTVPGPKENDGCPWGDADNDGIKDNVDQCPEQAGPPDNHGCPWGDADNDGLKDNVDKCPKEAEDKDGFEDTDGCPDPDNDKDGVLDNADKCPNEAGKPETQGCPFVDSDGDGIKDEEDKCPKEAGPKENNGCPWGDKDDDGLKDNVDKCPDEPEDIDKFEDEDGCPDPDNDKDGIVDSKDKCPDEPETVNGVKDDDGCPDKGKIIVIVKKEKIEILQKVHFATGKSRIMRDSFSLLNQVALVLKGHMEIKKIKIEGHTDSQGSEKSNQRLSERRANAVRDYLINKGGVDEKRLEAVGFGELKPIAPNSSRKGREANRRVEFMIMESE